MIRPSEGGNECIAANLTSVVSGLIFVGIPKNAVPKKTGLIWGIPDQSTDRHMGNIGQKRPGNRPKGMGLR